MLLSNGIETVMSSSSGNWISVAQTPIGVNDMTNLGIEVVLLNLMIEVH